jgi:cytochrome P450
LFAGHETTMIGIAWVMHFLHRNPEQLERTRSELSAERDLNHHPWMDAVVAESLRVRPIILGVMRELAEQATLGEYAVPKGTHVNVSIVMLHSDPEIYPEPDAFRPERFLDKKPRPWEYAPFGGGHRRCLGAAFAQFETKVVTATLLSRLGFEHRGVDMPKMVRRNLSMAPGDGIPLRVVERFG